MRAWSRWAVLAAAAVVFAAACWFGVGGLGTTRDWGDVGRYEDAGRRIVDGELPYRDFYVEYPPLALPTFVLPALVTDDEALPAGEASKGYLRAFKLQTATLGLLTLAAVAYALFLLGRSLPETALALGAVAVTPLALGHAFLNRFDSWPALLGALAVAALLARRGSHAAALLSLGFATKVFAAAAVPVAAIRLWRAEGRSTLVRAAVVFSMVALLCFGIFLVFAFKSIAFTHWTQARRQLQIESLAASLLLVAEQAGVYEPRIVFADPGSIDLSGRVADAAGVLATTLQALAVAAVAVLYLRARESPEHLVIAFAAAVTGFAVFGKVLSPQYLVWLVPLVVLVGGRRGRLATLALLAALGLTQLELQGYRGLHLADYAVWALLARNLLLVGLFVLLVDGLRPRKTFVT